ncbi:ATP-binding cassette domain-containing protein [Cellulomonas sp. P24]|uniref:ATP-binding cassette domain-containing protein n=1 Tax=Cellulomonas sp. P24 TaxID=2885206 RepID=UPI0037C18717
MQTATDHDDVAPRKGVDAPPLLRLRGISKHFGPVEALTDVDLDLPSGVVTALVGDNGAGKSSFIKCISGIHVPDHGEMWWEGGTRCRSARRRRRRRWGSRPSTRTSRCATTWTSSRTCSWGANACAVPGWTRCRWRTPPARP